MADPEWTTDMMEAMLITLAMERGGTLYVTPRRVHEAMERASRFFPNGMHAHWERNEQEGYSLKLVDRSKCDKSGEANVPHSPGAFPPRGTHAPGGLREIESLDAEEMRRLTVAQHILLTAAMRRLDTMTFEVTREEFEQLSASRNPFGLAALQVSSNDGLVSAAMINVGDMEARA